jgi:hypothetical protein
MINPAARSFSANGSCQITPFKVHPNLFAHQSFETSRACGDDDAGAIVKFEEQVE